MLFNPGAGLTTTRFTDRHVCHVMDDALMDPDEWARYAGEHGADFKPLEQRGYPGICLTPPQRLTQALEQCFSGRLRRLFDARRILKMHSRLSLVTTPLTSLMPYQWLCHRDGVTISARESIQASVLYLFKDESLGGTSFYVPARPAAEIAALFNDSRTLSVQVFADRYGIEPGYMLGSNAYFTCIGTVPARWNRMIVYDGSMLHSGHIASPDKLSSDPLRGRLSLNGFFTSRRHLV